MLCLQSACNPCILYTQLVEAGLCAPLVSLFLISRVMHGHKHNWGMGHFQPDCSLFWFAQSHEGYV